MSWFAAATSKILSIGSGIQTAFHKTWKAASSIIGLTPSDQSRATSNPEYWSKVICRLDLYINPGNQPTATGSGFFLNIPGASKDVLVTAGHNLIRPPAVPGGESKRTQRIGIRCLDVNGNPTTVMVTPTDYHITEQYEKSQAPENAVHDYGVILIDRSLDGNGHPYNRHGFGFNVLLAATDLRSSEAGAELSAQVGGYPGKENKDEKPQFRQGTGTFGRHEDRQVLYNAGTDQGMSGGPVWVNYDGDEVVVAIHNYHEEVKGAGNRGTRLDLRTMKDICRWAGVDLGLLDKAIKVDEPKPSPGIPAEGLYFQLGSSVPSIAGPLPLAHARSGHGRDPRLTTFDIVHAQASSSYIPKNPQFAVVHGRTAGTPRFLQFSTDPSAAPRQITGVEKLNAACLVQIEQSIADAIAGKPFKITMRPHHAVGSTSDYKVMLTPWGIPPQDNTFGLPLESLGLLVRPKRARAAKDPLECENFRIA